MVGVTQSGVRQTVMKQTNGLAVSMCTYHKCLLIAYFVQIFSQRKQNWISPAIMIQLCIETNVMVFVTHISMLNFHILYFRYSLFLNPYK